MPKKVAGVTPITAFFKSDRKDKENEQNGSVKPAPLRTGAPWWAANSSGPPRQAPARKTLSFGHIEPQSENSVKKPRKNIAQLPTAKPKRSFGMPQPISREVQDSSGLSVQQKTVLQRVQNGENIFYTGAAGTGKSYLLRNIIFAMRQKYPGSFAVAVTATTGMASSNIGGETIHSWSSIRLGTDPAHRIAHRIKSRPNFEANQKWVRCKVLIIDEISMLDGELLAKLEEIARTVRDNQRPFGGIQLVLTGDFYQLPPIDKDKQVELCFQHPVWQKLVGNNQIVLDKVFRQKNDDKLVTMLNEMRTGSLSPTTVDLFKQLSRPVAYDDGLDPTQLFPRRDQVERANHSRMSSLKGRPFVYNARDSTLNDLPALKSRLRDLMAPERLELRVGAQVLMIQNRKDKNLFNGSRGRVLTFISEMEWTTLQEIMAQTSAPGIHVINMYNEILEKGSISNDLQNMMDECLSKTQQQEIMQITTGPDPMPLVDFGKLGTHLITREEFTVYGPGPRQEEIAKREQLPLILSYALSIHKAQGQTIDRLVVDLNGVFAAGQAYVAVSRATSFDRLQVLGFHENKVKVDRAVIEFYEKLASA